MSGPRPFIPLFARSHHCLPAVSVDKGEKNGQRDLKAKEVHQRLIDCHRIALKMLSEDSKREF